ncbi:MAG: HEAT repeat domain-containing protein [Deltaproteobacteria bacterium]|nr:HEAT repeat domain-containing protein [Deltaproteobacteria bacterium]
MRRVLFVLLLASSSARADHFNWAGQVELDAEGLRSDDWKKRLDSVALLGMDDIHLAQPYLMRALTDDDIHVRHQAAKALGSGGATAAVPAMIEWLSDVDAQTRAVAADVLGDIGGPEATNALTRSLGDADDAVRQRAVRSLGKIGMRGNPNVVIALIPRLEDAKADVRRETIEQLEQLGDKRAVIPLVAKFGDTQLDIRKAAVRAVGKLGDKSAVPALIRLMNDPAEDVRTAAVGSLGLLGAVEALDALTEELGTGTDLFRAKVAYALGQIAASPGAGKAGEDAMKTLVENLATPATRKAATDALKVAGKAAVPALVAHLGGRLKGDPTTAVTLLAENADARATAALTAELERGRVAMPLVLAALGATHDPAALVPVLGALSNKDAAIRLAAMEALRPLLGSDARAGDVLVEHLDDSDLEVRVLAAEYLGTVKVAAAVPKLTALAGPGNPPRLRLAAIDALGDIGSTGAKSPAVTKVLIDALREGPPELHRSAATALAYIADPDAIQQLAGAVGVDRGPTRHELVRALAASMRGHQDLPNAHHLLRDLTTDSNIKVAIAAISGLAAIGDAADAPLLRSLVEQAAADRRRIAALALGDLHDTASFDTLATALTSKDDRLAGDAAWAVGEILAANPKDPHVAPLVERLLYAARHGGWAASIDATAALARLLWALPPADRKLVNRDALAALALHKSRLVRLNALSALQALGVDTGKLASDASPHVRDAAKAKLQPVARSEWRTFYVVDPTADDAPVREEPYFIRTPDGLVWATYTDARGEITSEHVPPGDADVWPASREPEY